MINGLIIAGVAIIALFIFIVLYNIYSKASIDANSGNFRDEAGYKAALSSLATRFESMGDAKRPITELLAKVAATDSNNNDNNDNNVMTESEQCLVNFYSLGCRFTGYIGPFDQGYFDPSNAVLYAVKAGCRCFVLEIDYLDECSSNTGSSGGDTNKYYPRLVVRDIQGKLRIKPNSNLPLCNSSQFSNIHHVCKNIEEKAFSSAAQNATDPVIIVLYFLRVPPGGYKSKTVLDYYSNVAKNLSPLYDRLVLNEIDGGSFYRQKQEGRLLINKISDYNGKILLFSNANTSGFRDVKTYSPMEDLDYLVNLRLVYNQTRLGVTENSSGGSYGILQTVSDYMQIPSDRVDDIVESTKLRWTICLQSDPAAIVDADTYNKISSTFGVNCVPIQIFDSNNDYMFTDDAFKKYSFMPKPKELRYVKPPIVIPGEPNPSTDAKGGKLRSPVV